MHSTLTPEQRVTLRDFEEITQISDPNLCRSILSQNNWNLEVAVENFVRRDEQEISQPQLSEETSRVGIPLDFGTTSQRHNNSGSLFDLLSTPLRWIFQSYPESLNPEQDAVRFASDFKMEYGEDTPQFQGISYADAVGAAFRESKFLLVYLHSPLHEDTPRFCRQVLSADSVLRTFNGNNLLTWGGNIWNAESYNLSLQLKVSTFPFLAVMCCESDRSVQIIDRIQGYIDERILLERLATSMGQARTVLNRTRSAIRRREEESLLRAEQDRDYLEAIESDRRAQEMKQRETETKARLAEEERQKEELEAAIQLSHQLQRDSQLARDRQSLESRPAPTSDSTTALIRFQLPQGAKLSRKFWKDDTVAMLYAFLRVHLAETSSEVKNFMVSTNFPKKNLTNMETTLDEAGLFPRGALFVQDLDA